MFAKKQPGQLRNRLAEVQYGTDIAVLVTQWLVHVNFISDLGLIPGIWRSLIIILAQFHDVRRVYFYTV
jgi:hypothetical protein